MISVSAFRAQPYQLAGHSRCMPATRAHSAFPRLTCNNFIVPRPVHLPGLNPNRGFCNIGYLYETSFDRVLLRSKVWLTICFLLYIYSSCIPIYQIYLCKLALPPGVRHLLRLEDVSLCFQDALWNIAHYHFLNG